MARANPLLKTLREACRGLSFPSETDAPFEAFIWPGTDTAPTAAEVVEKSGMARDTVVEQTSLSDFLRAIPQATRGDFLTLSTTLADHLHKVKVFKLGSVKKQAYIIGTTDDGKWAGVKTEVVET